MELLVWSGIVLLFALSIAGIFFPILPGILFFWGGVLLYHFFLDPEALAPLFWWSMGILTLLLFVTDYIAGAYFVKKYGGSRWAVVGSVIGMLLFPLFMGPIGILVGPFVLIFGIELLQGRSASQSLRVAIGSFFSFLSSSLVKLIVQTVMIVWFFIEL